MTRALLALLAMAAFLVAAEPAAGNDMLAITPPGDMTVTATTLCNGTPCAFASYSFTVTGGYPPYNVICNLPSPGPFLVGTHTISCMAHDSEDDSTPLASFTLTVLAGTIQPQPPPPPPPSLTITPPGDMTVTANMLCNGMPCAVASYSFTVSGGYPPYDLNCNLPSPGPFLVGAHTITCSGQDSEDDSTPPASFTLTVLAGTIQPQPPAPPPPSLTISAPPNMTVAANAVCNGTPCAVVSYSFTVSGGYPPYDLNCNLPSPGPFLLGSRTITCSGQDSEDDSTPPASFTLTVTPPATTGGTTTTPQPSGGSSPASSASPAPSSPSGAAGSPGGQTPSAASATPQTLAQASVAAPAIHLAGAGTGTLAFTLRLAVPAVVAGTLRTGSGVQLLRFHVRAAKGKTVVARRLERAVHRGTRLILRIEVRTGGRERTLTARFVAQ